MNLDPIYAWISPPFRRRRLEWFLRFAASVGGTRLLDVGGTGRFWERLREQTFEVTLLNVDEARAQREALPTAQFSLSDGCQIPFEDASFDFVFSNSVIEHVGGWERQQAFAREVRRVGRSLWIQTPAKVFPVEPHLLTPFVHWLPRALQERLIPVATVRGLLERWTRKEAAAFLGEVRLLTLEEMKALFPDCTIRRERFLGLTKSYIALRP